MCYVPELPDRGEKYRATGFEIVGGGPAATAAVAISKLGGRAVLAARVGDDITAEMICSELLAHGVDCGNVRRCPGQRSSASVVIVDARGERMIVNYLDPALPAEPSWLPGAASVGAAAVLVDTRWPEGALATLRAARALGLPAVLDADRPIPVDRELLRVATHVAFSADALADLTGSADPVRGLELAASGIDGWCGVTVGRDGVFALFEGELRHYPGFEVPVVDTLGAGDVWHGAFALALAEGLKEPEAVQFASASAALKVQRKGGRSGAPTRQEVEFFLAAHSAA